MAGLHGGYDRKAQGNTLFRRKSATQTRKLLENLARLQHEQQLRSRILSAQTALANEKNADLATKRTELENLLQGALARDSFIDFDSLKKSPRIPAFDREKPARHSYLPAPPSGLGALLPWKKTAYDRQYEAAEATYEKDRHAFVQARDKHQKRVAQEQVEIEKHNQEIERFKQDFAAGVSTEIENYFALVLEQSAYPAGFPKKTKVFFAAASATLRIDFELPALDVIPAALGYAYDSIRDELAESALPQKQRRLLYASVLAQISLRAIHEVFTADRAKGIGSIVFDGYVDGINPSNGQPGRFCLVALNITRRQFERLELRKVEPRACLKGLYARLSSKPDQLLAVPPMTQAENQDATVADGTDILQLQGRISELSSMLRDKETIIADLESRLEAQRDRIAELVPDLRDERARNAKLNAENQRQLARIAALEAEPPEALDDTQPAEAIREMTAERDFAEAGMFSPIVGGTPEAGAGGVRIPARLPLANQPVSLRELLQGTDSTPAQSDGETMAAIIDSADVHKLRDCIDWLGEAEAKLMKLLMTQAWSCSAAKLQSSFPGRPIIKPIVDNINESLYDVIGEDLIEEGGDLLTVGEEYRDALEQALKLTDNLYIRSK